MADATLAEAAALAGIDLSTDCLARYLHAIGLRSHATIAAYVHEDAVVNDLLTKLKAGVTVGTTEFKLPADAEENALKAQWLVLSRHARHKYQASFQGTPTPNSAPSQPATTTQPDKDSIPKALPSGVYSKLVEDYNSITLDGVRRVFPEKLLLGAEKVLARMYHEHHTSKLYTATPLGEIMAQRVWTSFNTINSNRKKDPSEKKLILDDKNQISEKTQEEWDVKGQWMLIDATQAIRWAWILLKYDSETAINKYVDWFHGLIRKNAQRIPNVKLLWEDFAWDIAMRMRSTETFTAITEDLMVDIAKVNEILQQPAHDEEDQIHQGQRLSIQQQGQEIPEVVTSGKRTEIPNVLPFDGIDYLDTVAISIHIVATPTTHVDMAAYATGLDRADSYNTACTHTDSDDTFQPGTHGPTTTHMVTQRE